MFTLHTTIALSVGLVFLAFTNIVLLRYVATLHRWLAAVDARTR